jgi:polyphosphate kinase
LIIVLKLPLAADPRLKQRVLDIFDILFNDTVKARYLDKELSNRYVPRGNRRKVRAQWRFTIISNHSNNPTNLCH